MTVAEHYDKLIEEKNDPVLDPAPLRAYMDRWDGERFLSALELTGSERVLEIGVGTGRLALRVVPDCRSFVGIDLSEKTVKRAREHLAPFSEVELVCGDFLTVPLSGPFDRIYSSLTLMHIENKGAFARKAFSLLAEDGILVLSLDRSGEKLLCYGNRSLPLYPASSSEMEALLTDAGFSPPARREVDFATVLICKKK